MKSDEATLGGYPISHYQVNENQHSFGIRAGPEVEIIINTMKDIVSVKLEAPMGFSGPDMQAWFSNSTGLMGSLETNKMIGRDRVTVLTHPNEMGQEWQGKAVLFVTV